MRNSCHLIWYVIYPPHKPLTDPARGEHCAHDAKCNYAALRALVGSVGRSKVCRA